MIGAAGRRSTKHVVVLLIAALFASALYASNSPEAAAEPILGGQLYSTGGVVQVEVLPATASLTSELWLFEPGPELLATNRDVGTIVEVGPFPPGAELIFGIRVRGNEFRLGPSDRNPDGLVHGEVDFIEPGVAIVGFEDLLGGGDLDYDDNVFRFTGQLAPVPPREIPDPIPLPVVDAGPDQTAIEGDVVSLAASEPAGPGVGAQSLVASIDRRTFPNDPDTSVEVALNGLADGVVDGSINLQSFGGESFNLINVIDLSGSTEFDVDGCGGDENNDGRSFSILDCEILAIVTLNDRLATGTDVQTALVGFGRRGVTADVDPADGIQAFTAPTTDADGNGIFDLEQVVRSVDVERIGQFSSLTTGGGTNFGEAVERACEVAANGQADRTVVAFMSDGEPFASRGIDLPCGDVVFRTFAVGGGAACEGRGTPSLQTIADLSGGSCVEIDDVSELPEVFALTIAPQVVAARLIVDGGAPVDVSDSLGVELPSSGAMTLVADIADQLVGASEVCLEVDVRDAVGVTPISTCSQLRQSDGTYTYQWRTVEQTGPPVLLVGANTATPSFVAFDDGRYVFEVRATDNVGQTVTDTVTVVVGNADPVVTVSSFDPSVGGVALLSGEFVDPGWDDVHSVQVSWGDGAVTDGVVGVQSSGQGTVFATHVYSEPGSYDVAVTVADDDGGAGTEALVAPPQVTSPAAIWADAADTGGAAALTFSGSNGAVAGLVHSNAAIGVQTCTNSFGGTVRYVSELAIEDFCGNPTDALALPVVTTATEPPLQLDIADFAPDGGVPSVVPGEYFDKTDRCRDGRWRVHDQDLAPGIYYVDCDVDFENASGEVTIVATGEIRTSGAALDFRPFFGSLLFLSGAVGTAAVTATSTNSRYTGAIYGIDGAVRLDGQDNAYVCGIYGDTVEVAGDRVTITGADCGDRPAGSIAAVLQPDFGLTLATSAEVLTPGDTAPFDVTLTNNGAAFVVPGVAGLQNIDAVPVTVEDLSVTIETRTAGSADWAPASSIGAIDVVVSPTEAPGVANGAVEGAVDGTTIEPNAIAVWGFQAIAQLTPATIAALTDPLVTTGIRLRVDFATEPDARVRPLYEIGDDFAASVHAQTGTIAGIEATFLSSNGLTRPVALNDLAPGATSAEVLDLPIAVPAAIRPGEPSTAYINRLRTLDGAEVVGAVFAVGSSDGQRVVAPVAVDNAVVQLPIVDTQKSGPADITSGDLVPWSIRLVNVGSVPAAAVEVIDTFGDQSLPVEGVAASIAPGDVVAATTSTIIPPDVTRAFTENRADTTWQDANGNTYGPTFGVSPLDVYSGPSLRAILIDELAGDPDGNSLISPGDAIRYTTSITNSGDRPLTGVVVTAPIDANTTFDAASVLGGTLISDPAAETIEIEVGALAGVSQTTVSWVVNVADPFPPGASTITSNATVSSTELPPVPASDPDAAASGTATETAIVVPFPVLEFELSGQLATDADNSGFVTPGDTLSYVGTIVNAGNAPADAAAATITLGDGLSLVPGSATTDVGSVTETTGGLSIDVGTLGPNQPVQLDFRAVIDPAVATGQSDVSVRGEASAAGVDAVPSDDPNTDAAGDPTSIGLGSTGVPVPGAGGGPGSVPPISPMPAVSTGAALAIDDSPVNPGTGATCSLVTPGNSEVVSEPTDIMATVEASGGTTIASWRVLTYPSGQPGAAEELATGVGAPPAALATFDPGARANGIWTILVETENSAGQIGRCESSVVVEGDLKLGRFTASWLDLDVPVAGVPIRVVRTYDTQDRNSIGDFGNGWDLSFGNFTIQTNTELGLGPFESRTCGGAFIFTIQCYTSTGERYVSITWPDGRVESFDFEAEGYSLFSALGTTVTYSPRGSATSTLSPAPGTGSPALGGDGSFRGDFFGSGDIFNPQRFILTDTQGTEYLLDKSTGLVSQTDLDGNTLTLGADGIRSSLGPEVRFDRDAQGRITQITDLEGGVITYDYDAVGDLVSVADQNGATTTYGYISDHYLDMIDEPDGGSAQRMTYDDDGRLASITDSNGNVTTISTNVDDRTEIITSPDGNLTTFTARDERGNLTTQNEVYDGVNHITTFTHNANDQITSRTDPEGNTWTGIYDDDDNLLSFTDAEGNTTSFTYDENNFPTTITDALGQVSTYDYDARGNLLTSSDQRGVSQTFTYDSAGNELTRTDALGRTWSATYASDGLVASETDPRGNVITHAYDASGRLETTTWPDGGVTRFTDDGVGNLVALTDPLGRVMRFAYDGADRVTSETDPDGFTTAYTYNGVGRITSMTDGEGRRWNYDYEFDRLVTETAPDGGAMNYTYDAAARIASMTDALGRTTTYEYDDAHRRIAEDRPFGDGGRSRFTMGSDANGRIVATTNGEGETSNVTFDAVGQLIASTDGLGRTTRHTYDASGNRTSTINPNGETTTWVYDLANQLVSVTDAVGAVTTFTYDAAGNRASTTDPLGRATRYDIDSMNRVVATTLPSGDVATNTYDLAGQLTSSTSAAGVTTTFGYNARGLLTSIADELGNTTAMSYDGSGRMISRTDARGNTTTMTHDRAGRLETETDPMGGVVRFTYDLAGQRLAVSDPNGAIRQLAYDDAGNLATEIDANGRRVSMRYDRAGRPVRTTDARGVVIDRTFDAAGQLVDETSPSETRTYAYDLAGRLTGFADASGSTSMAYDAVGRTTNITNAAGTVTYGYNTAGERTSHNQPQGAIAYSYDANGFVNGMTDWRGDRVDMANDADGRMLSAQLSNGVTSNYGYDAAGRLTDLAHVGPTGAIESYNYLLDPNGNRVGVTNAAGAEAYSLDPLNRVTAASYSNGAAEVFGYDAAGYRTSHTDVSGLTTTSDFDAAGQLVADSSGVTYTYDAAGNLTGSSSGDAYVWDDFGRMMSSTVGGVTQTYGYDALDVRVIVDGVPQLWDRMADLPNLIAAGGDDFVHGPAGVLREGDSWLLADGLGSIRATTAPDGSVAERFDFTAFGEPVGSVGTFGFAGEQHDPTGMIHLRARQYQPELGRFASVDPVQPGAPSTSGWNLYAYSGNNPTTWTDPSGELAIGYVILLGALLGFLLSWWTCDQSDNGWWRPSTNVSASCVITETVLGGIFAGFGGLGFGSAAGALGRRLAAACAWGAVEGGTGAAVHGQVQGDGVSASSVGIAAVFGCLAAGLFTGGSHWWSNRGPRPPRPDADVTPNNRPRDPADGPNRPNPSGDDYVDLTSPQRRTHILDGDATGGGHRWPGLPGKTPFPKGWSDDRIMHEISDIATDPSLVTNWQHPSHASGFTRRGRPARGTIFGERGGQCIKVVVEPMGEGIITAHPSPGSC